MTRRRSRVIENLKHAKRLHERPRKVPTPNYKGIQLVGIEYEKKVADYLKMRYGDEQVWHGSWMEFEDSNGWGYCSPDCVVLPRGNEPLVIAECKLSSSNHAKPQLHKLYYPVIRYLFPTHEIRLVQVCGSLRRNFKGKLITKWDDIYAEGYTYSTLSWRPW